MAAPLSFVVGAPDQEIFVRDDARATALDHAIFSRNVVAIGLLQRNYVREWAVWSSVLSTHGTRELKFESISPRVRGDLFCALRLAPASFRTHLNAWRPLLSLDGASDQFEMMVDMDTAHVPGLVLKTVQIEDTKGALELLLAYAANVGRADVISEILSQGTVLDITAAARLAIVEGHADCLERLLRAGPSFFPFLAAYAPGVDVSARHLCVIHDAVFLNDGAAIDVLRTRGVRMGPFTGWGDDDEPIDWACRLGHATAARAILRDPSVVQHIVSRKYDSIIRCCVHGHAETLKVLLESVHISHTHSSTTIESYSDTTPLQLATLSNDLKTVELVLEQGVDVNESHATRNSALAIAAGKHNLEIVAALLKQGASVKLGGANMNAIAHLLSKSVTGPFSSLDTVALLHLFLTERPRDHLQNNLLQYVKAYVIYAPVIRELLSAGAPVNDRSANGLTPLHIVVWYALTVITNPDIVRYNINALVLGGADLLAKTTAAATEEDVFLLGYDMPGGLTPMDVARTCGKEDRRDAVVADFTVAIAQRAL